MGLHIEHAPVPGNLIRQPNYILWQPKSNYILSTLFYHLFPSAYLPRVPQVFKHAGLPKPSSNFVMGGKRLGIHVGGPGRRRGRYRTACESTRGHRASGRPAGMQGRDAAAKITSSPFYQFNFKTYEGGQASLSAPAEHGRLTWGRTLAGTRPPRLPARFSRRFQLPRRKPLNYVYMRRGPRCDAVMVWEMT